MLPTFARSFRSLIPRQGTSILPSLTRYSSSTSSTQAEQTDGEKFIHGKLTERFLPSQLKVQDVSGGCGTFYAISITSGAFKGLSTIKQHKLVTETLKTEIEGIHGLQIKTIPE